MENGHCDTGYRYRRAKHERTQEMKKEVFSVV